MTLAVTRHTRIPEIAAIWKAGHFGGECPVQESGRQVTVRDVIFTPGMTGFKIRQAGNTRQSVQESCW